MHPANVDEDLGQGLNSSLEDVAILVDALSEATCVREAVQLYEARHQADIIALCRLQKIAFAPFSRGRFFQYHTRLANFILRIMLNKIAPRFFHPPTTISLNIVPYSEALKKGDETTARLGAICATIVGVGLAYFYARASG